MNFCGFNIEKIEALKFVKMDELVTWSGKSLSVVVSVCLNPVADEIIWVVVD